MSRAAATLLLGFAWGLAGPAAAGAAYEEAPVPDAGTLSGHVRFVGTPPRLAPLPVAARQRDACGDQKPAEALVVDPDGGVRGGVVLLQGVTRGKKRGGEVLVDLRDCQVVPHVSAAARGERVRVRNSDALLHHPLGFAGKTGLFNVALPGRQQVIDITRRLVRPGAVRVVCETHGHMGGWLVIHDSPYYAVTDERGAYRIEGIPPGAYRVVLWHEGFRRLGGGRDGRYVYDEPRTRGKAVTIAARGATTADFELR